MFLVLVPTFILQHCIFRPYSTKNPLLLKRYLCYKTIFVHKAALDKQLMNFLNLMKKCFILQISRFLCFCEILRFQNM